MTMNPIAIAKLYHIICNVIFIALFGAAQTKKRLLTSPLSNDLGIIETNSYEMLYLYYLV